MERENTVEFASRLWQYIIGDKHLSKTPSIIDITSALGENIAESTVYAWTSGRNNISVEKFISLYVCCRLADGRGPFDALTWMVRKCDPRLFIGRIQEHEKTDGKLFEDLAKLAIEVGELNSRVQEALIDRRLDEEEKTLIRTELSDIRSQIDHLWEETK